MEKMLVLCGVTILILPKWFRESYIGNHSKYCLLTQILGFLTILLGGLYWFDKIERGNFLCIILYILLLVWNSVLLWKKSKVEYGMVSKAMCIVDIILFLSSIVILIDIEEIASAMVILTCTLMNIYIPYSKVQKLK